ncbi:hypothetical protein SAMN05216262_106117 [Colwellia chukchiensis]|uniref:Uncharacterized protein n=1 Tax=Colwellia chukchiensis TaxID=641665 RepID=A0A1H7MSB8_9GAMM|nr:hypothetical protein SAMN05216262_106117 [Colwellia chukchiensis]
MRRQTAVNSLTGQLVVWKWFALLAQKISNIAAKLNHLDLAFCVTHTCHSAVLLRDNEFNNNKFTTPLTVKSITTNQIQHKIQ